ncbi:MAG: protein NO VEIN domain-containing protein [Candidatus Binatia bacterium]
MGIKVFSSNERRVAEDRRDCYWLYIVTNCNSESKLQEPIKDPARFPWHEVKKVEHYYLSVDALTQPMQVREKPEQYRSPVR